MKIKFNNNVGSIDLLQLLFIALKLMNYIDWPWWQVLMPIWISIIIVVLIIVFKHERK